MSDDVKTKNNSNIKNVIMKILIILAVVYIFYAILLIVKTPTDTITVEKGVLTEEETTTGIIIRKEKVVKGENYKNGIYQIVAEGEKAAKNQTIFRYYGKSEKELESKIEEVNTKIQEAMEGEKNIVFSALSSDVKNLENRIDEKIVNLSTETDIQKIAEIKKDISEALLKKAKIVGQTSQSGSYIRKLIAEREGYEKELEKGSEYMKAPISGIVSYRVDGLEEILGTENFENLNSQELEKLDVKTGKIVSANNESAKVIDNFECFIAAVLSSDAAKEAQEGDIVNLSLASGKETEAVIYKINEEDTKRIIIFKIKNLSDEFFLYRKISFNITWWSYSGIKVPNGAIIEGKDGLKYVALKTTTGTSNVLVKILKKNENYSIIGSYSSDDLQKLGIDSKKYKGISVYDNIMMYP